VEARDDWQLWLEERWSVALTKAVKFVGKTEERYRSDMSDFYSQIASVGLSWKALPWLKLEPYYYYQWTEQAGRDTNENRVFLSITPGWSWGRWRIEDRQRVVFHHINGRDDWGYRNRPKLSVAIGHGWAEVEPYVILPDSIPRNGKRLSEFKDSVRIDQAFIGSCANGLIEDLRVAAGIVRGRKLAPGVRFIVTPGSQAVYLQAVREGLVETLVEAGAVVTNSTCGACLGYHMGVLAPGEICITASPRNFKGRMGSTDAQVYLGSPATVAASALAGVISDPRTVAGTRH
jgi:hypothetical protein